MEKILPRSQGIMKLCSVTLFPRTLVCHSIICKIQVHFWVPERADGLATNRMMAMHPVLLCMNPETFDTTVISSSLLFIFALTILKAKQITQM